VQEANRDEERGYPASAIRFETLEAKMNLDLAALDHAGRVLVLGEMKHGARQIAGLERQVQEFEGDPGKPPSRSSVGAPQGTRREAWKLAPQLWGTRARTSGWSRRESAAGLTWIPRPAPSPPSAAMPPASELRPDGFTGPTPRIVPGQEG
jgi:hypothetical protein